MEKRLDTSRRRQVIHELRHQLRYAPPADRQLIRQELDFWQRQPK
jgi:hypothetical protein